MAKTYNFLIEVTPLNGTTPTTLRLTNLSADKNATTANGQTWLPCITSMPDTGLTLSADGLLDDLKIERGELSFFCSNEFDNHVWSSYVWNNAFYRAWYGENGTDYASYTLFGEGRTTNLERDGNQVTVRLLGPEADITSKLLTKSYLGTGNAEGPLGFKGNLKPRCFGTPLSVEPVEVDPVNLVYQVHGYGAVSAIQPYEYGLPLEVSQRKGNAASYAALIAMPLVPGEYATCLAEGMFRFGGTPTPKITADVTMSGGTMLSDIATAILTAAGVPAAKIGSFAAVSSVQTNLYVTSQVEALEALQSLFKQAGCYLFADKSGTWQCGKFYASTKTAVTLNSDRSTFPILLDWKEEPPKPPIKKVSYGFQRCWGVHSDSDASPIVNELAQQAENAALVAGAAQDAADAAQDTADTALEAVKDAQGNVIPSISLKAAIDAAKAEIQQISTEVTADFTEVNQAVDALQSDVTTAKSEISGLQSSTSAVQTGVSTLNGQMTTAQNNINSLQSSTSGLNTSVSALNNQMTTAQGNIGSLQTQASGIVSSVSSLDTRITSQGGQINTINSTLNTQGASISTLQTTVSNTSGDVATLKTQINAGGGNLLINTDLANASSAGWSFRSQNNMLATGSITGQPIEYQVPGENNFSIVQPNTTSGTAYAEWYQTISIEGGKWYDVSGYYGAHRCTAQVYIQWVLDTGATGSAPNTGVLPAAVTGPSLSAWSRFGFKTQAPANAVRANILLRKRPTDTGSDSWAWFIRPQVAETTASSATPLAYAPGSARASIVQQAQAISALDTSVSTLSTSVTTQGGSITSLQSTVTTLQGSVSTLSSTVATQGGSITTLQSSVSTAQGDVATLKTQVNAGSGNLLNNPDFAVNTSGWAYGLQNGAVADFVTGADQWMVTGENGVRLFQPNATATGYSEWEQFLAVVSGKWYDTSVRVAAHRCQVQVYISWRDVNNATISSPSSGLVTPLTGGSYLDNWTHVGFKAQAPAGAVRARIVLRKFGTLAGSSEPNSYSWWLRPQVAETYATSATPLAYSPGSSRASIDAQAQALNTATSSLATVSSTVATQGGSISSLQSSFTSLSGTVSSMSSTVSAQGSSISTLQSASSTQAGQISTLQSTVSTQGSSISTMQSTISSQGSDVATLKTQVNAGGGNLLVNTDLALDTTGWTYGTQNSATFGRNLPNSSWYPANENTLTVVQANSTTTGYSDVTQIIEVSAGKWYDVSVYAAQHRCSAELIIQWIDSSNNSNLGAPSSGQFAATGGGSALSSFVIRSFKAQAPAGAVRARFYLRKFGTNSGQTDSYAWFLRPQVVETLAGSATPVSYSPGSARATIVQQASALSTLNTSFSSLSSTVSSQGGSVATLQSSMTSAQGSISSLQSTVSSQGANISTLQSTTSTQSGQIASLNSTVSTQGSSISSLQSTVSSQGTSLSTLNTIVTASSNPNLIQNGGFENGVRGWTGGGRNPNNWSQQYWVWGYFANNSTPWTGGASGNYAYLDCTPFGVADNGNTLTMSFDIDFNAGAGSVAYGEVVWLNSSGGFISQSGTPQVGPRSFDVTGNGRVKGTVSAPVGASTAYARVVFYAPNGVTMNSMNIRQLKVEFGSTATPYSGEATAGQMYQAYATLDSSFATLSTTVASQGGSISTLQSSYTGLNGTVSSLNSTVSAQGSSISSLQSASSTQSGQISTLQTQVRAGGGNLLNNTDFAVDTAAWSFGTGNASVGDRVASGDQWMVTGENGLRVVQANAATSSQSDWTQEVAVEENKWYDVSVYVASHRANIQVYLQFINASGTVLSTPNSALIGPAGGGSTIANFVNRSFKGLAPAGTVKAKLYLRKFGTLSGADSYAWWLRPQVTETTATSASPVSYNPGSARASISNQSSAISTLTSQQATLSSTVSTQGSTISSQATALSGLQGSVGTLQSTVSTQGASIISLQTASSTTNGNVATLTTALYAGAPNLLKYGGFQAGLSGWNAAAPWQVSSTVDQNWGRFMTINATGNRYCNTDPQPVQVGQQYTISCDIDRGGTSGGLVAARIIWRNSSGGTLGVGPVASKASGGFSNSEADRVFGSGTCPSGAVDFYVQLVVEGVTGNQYWRRIKVNTGTTPGRYSEEASVVQSFETLSSLTNQYASLSGTVSTLNSSVTTQQTAINNLQGRTSAFWQVEAVAGGRAQLKVYADANGGAGVDITGDLRVHGNAMITGTINPEALSLGRFVKRINGSGGGSPNPGETRLLYAQDIGETSANGSYLIELNGSMTTTVGGQTGSYNSKPFYTNHLPDGGLLVRVNKNGSTIHETYIQATELVSQNNVGNKIVSLYRNIVVDSPGGGDSSTGTATILIYAIKGNQDTGIVNGGDYYSQNVSANYHAFSVTAKTKWTFI